MDCYTYLPDTLVPYLMKIWPIIKRIAIFKIFKILKMAAILNFMVQFFWKTNQVWRRPLWTSIPSFMSIHQAVLEIERSQEIFAHWLAQVAQLANQKFKQHFLDAIYACWSHFEFQKPRSNGLWDMILVLVNIGKSN